jgi:hypothetical protein
MVIPSRRFKYCYRYLAIFFRELNGLLNFKKRATFGRDGGLSILQYADGTMVFMDHNLDHACNLKLLLTAFE